jgi:uncharacterized protein
MKHVTAIAVLLVASLGLLVAPAPAIFTAVFAADFASGIAAFNRGDCATALREIRAAAEQGNAAAQNLLGFMYADGQGAPQDYDEALKWYSRAADQNDTDASNSFRFLYDKGAAAERQNGGRADRE